VAIGANGLHNRRIGIEFPKKRGIGPANVAQPQKAREKKSSHRKFCLDWANSSMVAKDGTEIQGN